jgi:hypothetical protein
MATHPRHRGRSFSCFGTTVVYRYHADDVPGGEGCFLNCSLARQRARALRPPGQATALMERLAARANDVGLFAEEIDRKRRLPRQLPAGARAPRADRRGDRDFEGRRVVIASAVAGGVIGTLAMADHQAAAEARHPDGPGAAARTAVTDNRRKGARSATSSTSFSGIGFAEAYGEFFAIVGHASWRLGALLGALHALFISTVLVSVLLPVVPAWRRPTRPRTRPR